MTAGTAAALLAAAFILQNTAGQLTGRQGITPDFLLCVTVVAALGSAAPEAVVFLAAGAAALQDICFSPYGGARTVVILMAGLAAVRARQVFTGESLYFFLLFTAAATAGDALIVWGLESLMGVAWHWSWAAGRLPVCMAENLALTALLYGWWKRRYGQKD